MNTEKIVSFGAWLEEAISKSSMTFKPDQPERGWGVRRKLETSNVFEVLPEQITNGLGQGVYIGNPFYEVPINISGINKPGFNGPENEKAVTDYLNTSEAFHNAFKEHGFSTPGKMDLLQTPGIEDTPEGTYLKALRIVGLLQDPDVDPVKTPENYLKWGSKYMSRKWLAAGLAEKQNLWRKQTRIAPETKSEHISDFYGLCDNFTCCTVAMAVNTNTYFLKKEDQVLNKIAAGTLVEVISCKVGPKNQKHVFCAVNRKAGSDLADPTSWGGACVALDIWYGLQRFTPDKERPKAAYFVKDAGDLNAPGDTKPENHYFRSLKAAKSLKVEKEFFAGPLDGINPEYLNVGAHNGH